MGVLIGIDIGTSGVRCVAFSLSGVVQCECRVPVETKSLHSGHAEQDPGDWWNAVSQSLLDLSRQLGDGTKNILGIGVTGQCPSFTLLGPDGRVSRRAILYHDERGVEEAADMVRGLGPHQIHARTGMNPTSFYLAPKLVWLKHHEEEYFVPGTTVLQPKDYINYRLTGRLSTDPTHAACTLLYDSERMEWILDWIHTLGLRELRFPEILPSCSILGHLTEEASDQTGLPSGLPISVGGADSLCAAFGANAWGEGVLCDVTGSTTCLHLSIDKRVVDSPSFNVYPHVAKSPWALETGLNTTGSAVNWLCKILGATLQELLEEAENVPAGCDGLIFLPHLAGGERDHPGRPGAFVGIRLEHVRGHLMRAVLEGCAFALRDRVQNVISSRYTVRKVVCCGGGSLSPLWNQIKANILKLPVLSVHPADTTAYGAALTVACALGIEADYSGQVATHYSPDYSQPEAMREADIRFTEAGTRLLRKTEDR